MAKYKYLTSEDGDVLLHPQTGLPCKVDEFYISESGNLIRKDQGDVSSEDDNTKPLVGNGPPPIFELGTPDPRSFSVKKGSND